MVSFRFKTGIFLCAAVASAQTLDLTVVGASPQQALIHYRPPSNALCSLALVSEGVLAETVWDVNEVAFTGSSYDLARSNTTEQNGIRQVLLGSRQAKRDRTGKLRSLSLQANTPYTLTVKCEQITAITTFTTANIPVGNLVPDPPDTIAGGFGGAAWPTVDWTDPMAVYIDPKTGLGMRPAAWFGRVPWIAQDQKFLGVQASSSSWTNLQNLLQATTSLATVSGSDPAFLSLNINHPGRGSASFAGSTLTDLRLRFTGNGVGAATTLNFCLSADSGQSCFSRVQSVTLPAAPGTAQFPSVFPSPLFSNWNLLSFPQHNLVLPWVTAVSSTGDNTTIRNLTQVPSSTGLFPTDLARGSKVFVQGSSCPGQICTVQSVPNATTMVLVENPGRLTGAAAVAANFGVRVWLGSAGSANLGLTYDVSFEPGPGFLIEDGASDQCSSNTFLISEDADGRPIPPESAYLCLLEGGAHSLHLLIPRTGEMRQVGLITAGYSGEDERAFYNTNTPNLPTSPWDPSDGRVLYGLAYNGLSQMTLTRWRYRGQGRAYKPQKLEPEGQYSLVAQRNDGSTECPAGERQWTNLCVSMVTSPGQGLIDMLKRSSPAAAAGLFGNRPLPIGIIGNVMALYWQRQQDALAAYTYVDLDSGAQVAYADTLGNNGARWGGAHTNAGWIAGSRHLTLINPLGSRNNSGPSAGPYRSNVLEVWRGGFWDPNTAVNPTDAYACPAPFNGQDCLLVRIGGMPCSSSTDPVEVAFSPCPWNPAYAMPSPLQAGDLVGNISYQGHGANSETMRVLSINALAPGNIELLLRRYINRSLVGPSTFAAGWSLSPYPSLGDSVSSTWWFDATGNREVFTDYPSIASHVDIVSTAGGYIGTNTLSAKFQAPSTPEGFSSPAHSLQAWGTWAGLAPTGEGGYAPWPENGSVEFYPSCRQVRAPAEERVWCGDWRAYQGGAFTGANAGTVQADGVKITPVPNSPGLYKFSLAGSGFNPKLVPLEGWGGRFFYRDISGPRSVLTTLEDHTVCRVYLAGECVPGSSPGEIYFASTTAITDQRYCFTNHMEADIPCFFQASPLGSWAVQQDISQPDPVGNRVRRLTMGFTGPGRQNTAANWRPTPDGKWGLLATPWADGVSPVLWLAKLPPWPGYDAVRRDHYVQIPIQATAGAAFSEIRFGYEEYGTTLTTMGYPPSPVAIPSRRRAEKDGEFLCSARRDTCASRQIPDAENPFQWINSDGHSGTPCLGGCLIPVPALSGRILWWLEYHSNDGTSWSPVGRPQRVIVP